MSSDDSMLDHSHSITRIVDRLKHEDDEAAGQIWQRYFERLLPVARAGLSALSHRTIDEEDVLISVFDRFFRAARENRFLHLQDRGDLWQILLMLTERKVADHYRRAGAQKRRDRSLIDARSDKLAVRIEDIADEEPGPEFVAAFNDRLSRAMPLLSDKTTREVALLRMEGYQNREIAGSLDISLSSVERKLRVIRQIWEREQAD